MSRIFWDTNLFIYLLGDYRELSKKTIDLRRRMLQRGDQLLTSAMTLGEILVRPMELGDEVAAQKYEADLSRGATIIPFDLKASRIYAKIRTDRGVKPPDAIQLACAANAVVDLFVTNDTRLQGKFVPGIQFIASLDMVPI